MKFELSNYSQAIQSIVEPAEAGRRLMPLAPAGAFSNEGLDRLRQTPTDALFDAAPASNAFAQCAESALYLYFSDLDRSHRISQDIPSTTGSFLHGIMHRQEPDYSNAKYWFRKVASHPVHSALRDAALHDLPRESRLRGPIGSLPGWDVFWMVEQCEAACRSADQELENELLIIQGLEWRLLFDYCYRQATGRKP
ncbi:MAG: hypothetical protein O2968_21535 [Acidobacteria bacterium]|nr:hypothetical protein [Acidobacteriota bacterium]